MTQALIPVGFTTFDAPPLSFPGDLDSGIYWVSGNNWGFSAAGAEVAKIRNFGNPQLAVVTGVGAAPSISSLNDADSGINFGAALVDTYVGSALRLSVVDQGIRVRGANQIASAPPISCVDFTTTGLFWPASGVLAVSAGGAEAVRWNSSGQSLGAQGTITAPTYSFAAFPGLGIYAESGSGRFTIASGGANLLQYDGAWRFFAKIYTTAPQDIGVSFQPWATAYLQRVSCAQPASSSGTPAAIGIFVGAAHTGLAIAEAVDVDFDLDRTVTFGSGGGTLATQRSIVMYPVTYDASAALTITDACTLDISAPVQTGNVTITNRWALRVNDGQVGFPAGTETRPGLVCATDNNTGIAWSPENFIYFVLNSSAKLKIGSQIASYAFGSAAAPMYSWVLRETDGVYSSAAGQVSIAVSATELVRVHSGGVRLGSDGTTAAPAYSFLSNTAWGFGKSGNSVLFCLGGTRTIAIGTTQMVPDATNVLALGATGNRWSGVFTVALNTSGDITHTGSNIGFFSQTPTTQQTSGANLTNNVTSGGTDDIIADFTDLSTYANDAATIRNDIYQLARKLKQVNDGLRAYGLLS